MKNYKHLLVLILTASLLFAAATHTGDWVLSGGRLSFGTGGIFQLPNGTTPPATCGVADLYFDTDATAGQNLFGCTATNTMTQLSGAGGSTPNYVLYRQTFGLSTNVGGISSSPLTPGAHTSTTGVLAGGTLRPPDGAFLFDDIVDPTPATEILYIDLGPLPSGYNYAAIELTAAVQNRQGAAAQIDWNVSFACIGDGDPSPTDYSTLTYSTAQTHSSTPDSTTTFDIYVDSTTGLNATTNSSGCGAGDQGVMRMIRSNTDANTQPAALWSLLVEVPAL